MLLISVIHDIIFFYLLPQSVHLIICCSFKKIGKRNTNKNYPNCNKTNHRRVHYYVVQNKRYTTHVAV